MSLNSILTIINDDEKAVEPVSKYIEADKNAPTLRGILQSKRLKLVKESSPIRRGVSFAPHSITYPFCRRMKIGQLAGLVDIYYDKSNPSQQTGFDIGTALHNMVQGYFWDVGMLKGTYECLKCDKLYHDTVAPMECPSGKKTHKKKHLRYREVTGSNDQYSLYGRSDGILVVEDREDLLEIKSLAVRPFKNPNDFQFYFDDLDEKGPRENHIVQLQLYLLMLKKDRGHLLYISKNDGRMKTYPIDYDQTLIDPYLNEMLYLKDQAALLLKGEKISLPPCCASDACACHSIISPIRIN